MHDESRVVLATRKTSKHIASNPTVQRFAEKWVKEVWRLVHLMSDASLTSHQKQQSIVDRLHVSDLASAGQVPRSYESLREVVNEGNLRERMTLIHNFANTACDIIWELILACDLASQTTTRNALLLKSIVSIKDVKRRSDQIQRIIGIPVKSIACQLRCRPDFYKRADCKLAVMTNVSATQAFRGWRVEKVRSPVIRLNQAYPPLSRREIEYMFGDKKITNSTRLTWLTGNRRFFAPSDTLLSQLVCLRSSQSFASVSGSTARMLDILLLFKSFNNKASIKLGVCACIAWMGNPPDHTVLEMLLAANTAPFNLGYDPADDEHQFALSLLTE